MIARLLGLSVRMRWLVAFLTLLGAGSYRVSTARDPGNFGAVIEHRRLDNPAEVCTLQVIWVDQAAIGFHQNATLTTQGQRWGFTPEVTCPQCGLRGRVSEQSGAWVTVPA